MGSPPSPVYAPAISAHHSRYCAAESLPTGGNVPAMAVSRRYDMAACGLRLRVALRLGVCLPRQQRLSSSCALKRLCISQAGFAYSLYHARHMACRRATLLLHMRRATYHLADRDCNATEERAARKHAQHLSHHSRTRGGVFLHARRRQHIFAALHRPRAAPSPAAPPLALSSGALSLPPPRHLVSINCEQRGRVVGRTRSTPFVVWRTHAIRARSAAALGDIRTCAAAT